ncbi:hypothetical protein MBLNU13_g09444t1 [Cladosporium sp. NU13]
MAPGNSNASNSNTSNKATTDLSAKPAEKPDTMLRTRFLQNWDPHYQPTTAEKPTLDPEERKKAEERKKTVLADLKKFAQKFKLKPGPYVLHFQTRKNDIGKPLSVTHPVTHPVALETSAEAASRRVFQTSELLEMIASFLPMKKIVDVQRVAKQWKNVIAGSPSIQEKLFTRRENKEQEIWVLVKRKPVIGPIYDRPKRVEALLPPGTLVFTPVSLNPMLHETRSWIEPNGFRFPISTMPDRVSITFCAWANALRYNESCIRNMLITDPPCTKLCIESLILYLGFHGTRLQHPHPDYFDRTHPKQDALSVKISGITVESASGLTMRDIFKAALHSRGKARLTLTGGYYHERRDATVYEMLDLLMLTFGWISVPESPFMELSMNLLTLNTTTVMIATDWEREMAKFEPTCRGRPT